MMSIKLSNISILNIKGSNCRCIISLISKNKTIKLMQNTDLTKKRGILKNICIKMSKEILMFGKTKRYRQKSLFD